MCLNILRLNMNMMYARKNNLRDDSIIRKL